MNIDERVIITKFAVAIENNDDSTPYLENDGCFLYYNSHTDTWGGTTAAETTNNEYSLVKLLEDANRNAAISVNVALGYNPFPITVTTTISSLNSEKFNNYLAQSKREAALKKLTEEDKVVLGLTGEKE